MEQTRSSQYGTLASVLISEQEIAQSIEKIGSRIAHDYQEKDLVLIGILKGSYMFIADVARAIAKAQQRMGVPTRGVSIDFLAVQSYGDETVTSGVVRITADVSKPVEGKHVVIVEDIVDTGLTMSYLIENVHTRNPASVRVCAFLHKPSRTVKPVTIDYLGFTIDDHFVVGYGLDYKQQYRHLPYIATVTP